MATKTPLDAGFVARAVAGLRFAFTGKGGAEWFGPAEPMEPMAPEEVKGRQFDYSFGINRSTNKPRSSEAVTFEQLRALADNYDLMRTVIEKRKDQIGSAAWTIRKRDVLNTRRNESTEKDERVEAAIQFFRNPDKQSGWDGWIRQVLEDLLVLDAPVLYVRKTLGGEMYALEPVDGSTIKRVLDGQGRTPAPPEAAYQQILKGLPAVNYSTDELIYRPRNPRTHKVYGYSPVEQVIMTVNIALRRQTSMLDYYREGSVPDAMVGVPSDWQPEQIQQWQEWWDAMLAGSTAERRKTRFVPGELAKSFVQTKQPPLKDLFDEWLARVVCFAFSIEPTPFVSQVNRATSETSREQSISDGQVPLRLWVKNMIDDVLARHMGLEDLEFVWDDTPPIDPKVKMEISTGYINAKVLTVDEVRAELGYDPMPEEEKPEADPEGDDPPPEDKQAPESSDKDKQEPEEKGDAEKHLGSMALRSRRLKKAMRPIDQDRPTVEAAIGRMAAAISGFLRDESQRVAAQLADRLGLGQAQKMSEAERKEIIERAAEALDALDFSEWSRLIALVSPPIEDVMHDAGTLAVGQVAVAVGVAATASAVTAAPTITHAVSAAIRTKAAAAAHARAAEMVGMKWVGGELVPNPNARWQITEGTRTMLRATTEQALREGWSAGDLSQAIQNHHAFSGARANMIARTELAKTDVQGQIIGWQQTGMVSKQRWLTAVGCCEECEQMDGMETELGQPFTGGVEVPMHPHCRCTVLPVLDE